MTHGSSLIAALTLVLAWNPPATAEEPSAEARLGEVVAAYRGLAAYADRGAVTLDYRRGGEPATLGVEVPLRFVRSDRMLWDAKGVTAIAAGPGGKTAVNPFLASPFSPFVADGFLGRRDPGPIAEMRTTPTPPDVRQVELLQLAGPILLETLATLMVEPEALERVRDRSQGLRCEPDRDLDGRPAWIVAMQPMVQAPVVRIWIDPESKLIRRMDMTLPKEPSEPEDDPLGDAVAAWSSGPVATDRDAVLAELDAATADLLARTAPVEPFPPPTPPVPTKALPGAPFPVAPSKSAPAAQAPVAPSKAAPTGFAPAPGEAAPMVAVSLLVVAPAPQAAPAFVSSQSSMFRRLYCRIYPQNCRPASPPS
ncbi:hypothetical protein [Paludisphaera soli]|uniref:hypothetical protein n=1 Tax=Paludisphaera soli TaxID=2712865 RepID=UPI0013EB09CD|nr:hypothetical protein [Paludisphaera soli]